MGQIVTNSETHKPAYDSLHKFLLKVANVLINTITDIKCLGLKESD